MSFLADVVLIEGQAPGGSIVGISPGISLANTSGGGSIVGITPGAALERKSVKDLAAGLSRLGGNSSVCRWFVFLLYFVFLVCFRLTLQ